MMRIAMLSGWHVHAPGYAREIQARSDARITAVWDEDPDRGRKWAADLGVPFEECLDTVLGSQYPYQPPYRSDCGCS
jgi:predicted dehydrogenase